MFQSIPAAQGLSRSHDKSNEMCSKYTFTNNGCANVHFRFFLVLLKPNIAIILLFILLQPFQHHLNQLLQNAATLEKTFYWIFLDKKNDEMTAVWWAKKIKPIVLRRCAFFFSVWFSIFVYYLCDLHCRSVCLHRCVCVCLSCVSVFLLVFAHIPARGR